MSDATGIVIPIGGDGQPEDPWHALAQSRGILITWADGSATGRQQWGSTLGATSSLAQQFSTVLSRSGAQLSQSAETLFRLELPTGSSLRNLVPAVGGGFRGMVRPGEGSQIAGHARLIAVDGAAVGAGIALGPLVGLMALSVGAEMLARRQTEAKLDALVAGVNRINQEINERRGAELRSAAKAITTASAALLDRTEVPETVALGPACHSIRTIKEQAVGWIADWSQRCDELPAQGRVSFDAMRETLAGPGSGDAYRDFPSRVATAYQALALDSRALVLTEALAALRNPQADLAHMQSALQAQLSANAIQQDELRKVLWRLSVVPVHTQKTLQRGSTDKAANRMARAIPTLAAMLSAEPAAPALLSQQQKQVLELVRSPSGEIKVLDAPTA
jgi:hypothetical protein